MLWKVWRREGFSISEAASRCAVSTTTITTIKAAGKRAIGPTYLLTIEVTSAMVILTPLDFRSPPPRAQSQTSAM